MSLDKSSGGDQHPDKTPKPEHRPFPGAPKDRPVPSKPVAWRSFEEIRAERAARAGDKGPADRGPARPADHATPGQPASKDAGKTEEDAQPAMPNPGSDRHPGSTAQTGKTLPAGRDGPGSTGGPRPPDGGGPPALGRPGHGKDGILHGHSEFHGQKLDLYSDGTRWIGGDAVRAAQAEAAKKQADGKPVPAHHGITDIPGMREQGANVVGDKPPDDETELPPDRKELLEADGRKKSLKDRLLDRLEDEEVLDDLQDKGAQHADTLQQLFGARPQHATAGDIFSAVLLTSVALAESGRRMHDMLSRRREER